MIKRGLILVLIAIIATLDFSSASFTVRNYSLDLSGSYVAGWINISFQNENSQSNFSYGDQKISLADFINNNGEDYTCNPASCNPGYSTSNPEERKNISLLGQSRLLGVIVNGSDINSMEFSVHGNFVTSCISPIEIDFFDDNAVDFTSGYTEDYSCKYESGTGCYNNSQGQETNITGIVCEKMKFTPGEKYMIGAWVKRGQGAWSNGTLKMSVYSSTGTRLKTCNLPEPSSSGGEMGCNISLSDYNSGLREYYVCLNSSAPDYLTRRESNEPCGAARIPPIGNFTYDYYIYAKGARFAGFTEKKINNGEFKLQGNSGILESKMQDYLSETYNNNCAQGCVIPINVKVPGSQSFSFDNLSLAWDGGWSKNFYDSAGSPVTISTNTLSLDLENLNFNKLGGTFELLLNGQRVIYENSSENRIRWIAPTVVPAAASVKFYVNLTKSDDIENYYWDFGDGNDDITQENSVSHVYSDIGDYTMEVTATATDGTEFSKSVEINVVNPKDRINQTIKKYKQDLINLKSQVGNEWYASLLEQKAGVTEKESKLGELEARFNNSTNSSSYVGIMDELTGLNMPEKIWESESGNVSLVFDTDVIDLEALKEMGAGEYDAAREEELKQKIVSDFAGMYSGRVGYKVISAMHNSVKEDLITVYKLELTGDGKDSFFILDAPFEEITFKDNPGGKDAGTGVGFFFPEMSKESLEFAINGRKESPREIGYLSGEFSKFETGGVGILPENPFSPAMILVYVIIGLVLGLATYFIIRKIYRVRQEARVFESRDYFVPKTNLFKNENELFNLVNFVNNAVERGIDKNEARRRLVEKGWLNEEIDYGFNNKGYLDSLVRFVNSVLDKGTNAGEVKRKLEQAGWHSEEIEYAFKSRFIGSI